MKRIFTLLLLVLMLMGFTACGPEKSESASSNKSDKGYNGDFSVTVYDVTVTPGKEMPTSLPEAIAVSKVPSSAFDGEDDVYFYGDFEIIAHILNGENKVCSVNFIGAGVSTDKGLSLGDSMAKMTELYGEGYEVNGSEYYYKGKTTSFRAVIRDDAITSLEIKQIVQ